ncbi:HEAT repeat-containing protein 1 [Clydaea vesicula]|uniref:U3 small nucleolar RNA-associated protein 10 n=1 Tax=Clydaea vesicula TaxID=447962 RepID=A0AAD5Y152_9FUNG|nr:HEAT repeat-containing protein 1 [Clydaea vesicula]
MPSLKDQLKGIQKLSQSAKNQPSLLFSKSGDIDSDAVLDLAKNGLAELVTKDKRFLAFEDSIFSDFYKNSNIELQSPEILENLKKSIANFLILLSPYFLLKPSLKVLEWLIRRFKIHKYSIEQVMLCILPYHESLQFVNLVSLFQFHDTSSKWSWLKIVQQTRVPLDRNNLVQRCYTDSSILNSIFEMVRLNLEVQVVNKPLWSFFATTVVHYIAAAKKVNEKLVRTLLPISFEIMKFKSDTDLQSTALMIFAQICHRSQLSNEVLKEIFDSIAIYVVPQLEYLSLLTIITICQTQSNENVKFGSQIVKRLSEFSDLVGNLTKVSISYQVDSFLIPFLKALEGASESNNCYYILLLRLIKYQGMDAGVRKSVISPLCDELLKRFLILNKNDERASSEMIQLLQGIQLHYSEDLSLSVDQQLTVLKNGKTDVESTKALYSFISSTFQNTLFQPDYENNTVLYLSLYHLEESVRIVAYKRLSDLLQQGDQILDKEFLDSVILDGFESQSNSISETLLEMPLQKLIDHDKLVKALITVVEKSGKQWLPNRIRALDMMIQVVIAGKVRQDIIVEVEESFQLASCALELVAQPDFPFKMLAMNRFTFTAALHKLSDSINPVVTEKLCKILIKVANAIAGINGIETKLFEMAKSSRKNVRYLSTVALFCLLQNSKISKKVFLANTFIEHIREFFKTLNIRKLKKLEITKEGRIPKNLLQAMVLYNDSIPVDEYLIFSTLNLIIRQIAKPKNLPNDLNIWSEVTKNKAEFCEEYQLLMKKVYVFVLVGSKFDVSWSQLLEVFFSYHSKEDCLQFLTSFLIDKNSSTNVLVSSLNICSGFILSSVDANNAIDYQLFIPVILISLLNIDNGVRQEAVKCLEAIDRSYQLKSKNFSIYAYDQFFGGDCSKVQYLTTNIASKFVSCLISQKESLLTTEIYLPNVMESVLGATEAESIEWEASVLLFLNTCVLACSTSFGKVQILNSMKLIKSAIKIKTLYPLIEDCCSASYPVDERVLLLPQLVKCFDVPISNRLFDGKQRKFFKLFLKLLSDFNLTENFSTQVSMLTFITEDWFSSVSLKNQAEIFSIIVLLSVSDSTVAGLAKRVLSAITLDASILTSQFTHYITLIQDNHSQQIKRLKADSKEEVPLFSLITLLELFSSLNIINKRTLVRNLFEFLGVAVSTQNVSIFVSLEYIKQLILAALLDVIAEVKDTSDENELRVDYVVQCIRTTDNPQTHNASLILMAAIAKVNPDPVLINIMPVFTFMGANVLRQDDNYSFYVIRQTLETILPALLSKHNNVSSPHMQMILSVKPVLKVFVDALFHIPKHRRLTLFSILVSVLGPNDFLQPIISLLVSKAVGMGQIRSSTASVNNAVLEFAASVSCHFDISSQLKMILESLDLVKGILNTEDDTATVSFFDSNDFNEAQLYNLQVAHIECISIILGNPQFLEKLKLVTDVQKLEDYHVKLVGTLFSIMSSGRILQKKCETEDNKLGVSFSNNLVSSGYSCLNEVHELLTIKTFIKTIAKLLVSEDTTIVCKSLTLLNEKTTALKSTAIDVEVGKLYSSLVPVVLQVIEGKKSSHECKQNGLLCLTTMIQLMSKKDVEVYIRVLPLVCEEINSSVQNVAISALTCLTCLCNTLGTRTITHLPTFMPSILNILSDAIKKKDLSTSLKGSQLFIYTSITALTMIVKALPKFISPYIPKILDCCLSPLYLNKVEHNKAHQKISEKNLELCFILTERVPCRILLPAMFNHLKASFKNGVQSLMMLFRMTSKILNLMNSSELNDQYLGVFRFFIFGFDYRESIIDVENYLAESCDEELISSFLTFVGKLNDAMFRSLFLNMVEWAFAEEGLMNAEKFHKIYPTVIKQITKKELHSLNYLENMNKYLIPCIGQLAVNVNADDLWKPLIQSILMTSREEDAEIKITTLKSLEELYRLLGEDLLVFLPETIPFLAELNEDDDPKVEKASLKLCSVVEGYLGESLEQYFTK